MVDDEPPDFTDYDEAWISHSQTTPTEPTSPLKHAEPKTTWREEESEDQQLGDEAAWRNGTG